MWSSNSIRRIWEPARREIRRFPMLFPSSSGDLVGSWGMFFLTFCTATRNDSLWLPSRLVTSFSSLIFGIALDPGRECCHKRLDIVQKFLMVSLFWISVEDRRVCAYEVWI